MARSPEVTHKIMSAIKPRNTEPEMLLRKALWRQGLRFRVNYTKLPGRPDVVFTRAKVAVFCDGDFWHGNNWRLRGLSCLDEELSKYNDYWSNKILHNIERDEYVNEQLKQEGWVVLRFWESTIRENVDECAQTVSDNVKRGNKCL